MVPCDISMSKLFTQTLMFTYHVMNIVPVYEETTGLKRDFVASGV